MTRRDDIHSESEFGPGAEHGEDRTALDGRRTSWPVRSIQLSLAVILAFVVFDGLRRRARGGEVPREQRKAAQQDARSHDTILVQSARDATTRSDPREHSRAASGRSLPTIDEGLTSLHDLADYLELHQVAREARGYELGSAAPEALMHLATTSGNRRVDLRADRDR